MEEAKRQFRKGFQVDGTALAGLFATTTQHLAKTGDGKVTSNFKVELKDGSSQTLPDVGAVTALQNVGKKEIRTIEFSSSTSDKLSPCSINIVIGEPERSKDPTVSYTIEGKEREWVRSAQIDIDDFVSGISRLNIAKTLSIARIIIPLLVMVGMLVLLYSLFASVENIPTGDIDALKRSLQGKEDAASAILAYAEWQQESAKAMSSRAGFSTMKWILPLMALMPISVALSHGNINRIFKSYVFYTGGMVSIVNQRRTMHSIFWLGIVLAIAVGLFVNYLSDTLA